MLCRVCRYSLHNWKTLSKCLATSFILCWLLWISRRPLTHAVNFIFISAYRECAYRRRTYELEEKSSRQYVTLKFHGRLGNWMFSYASLLGIAKANGYIPYFSSSHPLNNYFALSKVQNVDAECLQSVFDDYPCTYNPQFMNLLPGNISIDGYLQSWKYFRFMEKEVRKEFTMHESLLHHARERYLNHVRHYLQEGRVVISIHIRRGDVLKPEARKLGFCDAPKAYFDNAMRYMLRRYPHAVFFVASDDMSWCQSNLIPPKLSDVFDSNDLQLAEADLKMQLHLTDSAPIVFSNSYSSIQDFAMLTLCNHSILSVGTFGWWSAWLANGDVVYYSGFPLHGTKVDYEMKKEDFFPEHWVALSDASIATPLYFLICVLFVFLFLLIR